MPESGNPLLLTSKGRKSRRTGSITAELDQIRRRLRGSLGDDDFPIRCLEREAKVPRSASIHPHNPYGVILALDQADLVRSGGSAAAGHTRLRKVGVGMCVTCVCVGSDPEECHVITGRQSAVAALAATATSRTGTGAAEGVGTAESWSIDGRLTMMVGEITHLGAVMVIDTAAGPRRGTGIHAIFE